MVNTLLLIPPNDKEVIRDTYYGCWHEKKWINYSWPPLSLFQLAAIIPDSEVLDAQIQDLDSKKALHLIKKMNPKFIIVNTGTYTIKGDIKFLEQIKRNLNTKIILFGQHPTSSPKDCLKYKCINFVIRGEPEPIINDLIINSSDKNYLKRLKGVCFNKHINSKKAYIHNLDRLPFPKRDLNSALLYQNPFAKKYPFATLAVSRGCPYSCKFCTVPTLYGRKYRKRLVSNVIQELRLLKVQGYNELFFRDENLTLDRVFIKKLCKRIIDEKLNFSWICNSRVDTADKDVINIMKKAGCHLIKFGVESSSTEILRKLNKGVTIKQIKDTFKLCKKLDMETMAHFMIGNPGETEKSIMKTIKFSKKLNPLYASFDILIKYPETRLYKKGRICDIDNKRLKYYHDLAFKKFYLTPKTIIKHISNIRSMEDFKNKVSNTLRLWGGFFNAK